MSTMQTPYENLGDRRFQMFAQSLLSYEFPDLQALPVGQPDGGRDAISLGLFEDLGNSVIFQVKFVERPDYVDDVDKWLTGILAKEKQSIDALAAGNVRAYYLITNVPGSAHPGVGSIDKGVHVLDDVLPIPGQVWWRTDLEVRLAKHRDLKWHYRELLSGQDVLDELVASGLSDHRERRRDAVDTAMSAQYETDKAVRFKQVELQSDILGLFVDVPLSVDRPQAAVAFMGSPPPFPLGDFASGNAMRLFRPGGNGPGAAEVLLDQPSKPGISRLVLEGAPGQGKSTLAQFVCQVHRMQLLQRHGDLSRLSEAYRSAPTRLPFKVDLREFATFIRGQDPFHAVTGWGGFPENWPRSLEGFLAGQIRRYSGGAEFSVSDLHALTRTGPMLLMLDGLDEVADVGDRRAVIEAVNGGLASLGGVAKSLQVVVTSRKPGFANAPAFSRKDWAYGALDSLTTTLIVDYTKRWAEVNGLSPQELADVLAILDVKLEEPHMRDLCRNPMQLAILLSLINMKGESLPDKRTQLYSEYMGRFFDRESAKSSIVQKHRDILYGLHGHLAWLLHCAAEQSARGGSIGREALEREVATYLEAQGADAALAAALFQGVVERIFALVSARQGEFEFEVQPLREYFAAHHLYMTAQVSELGIQRPGTRADRFAGLARSAFWQNVVRFYAGFYSSGELPSLADGIEALATDPELQMTNHPRTLTSALLGDWSLSLDRRSRERAIHVISHGLGKRHVLGGVREEVTLPAGSGGIEIAEQCLQLLRGDGLAWDRRHRLLGLYARHADVAAARSEWYDMSRVATGLQRTRWLMTGARHGLAGELSNTDLSELLYGDKAQDQAPARAWAVARGGSDSLEDSPEHSEVAMLGALEDAELAPVTGPAGVFPDFARALHLSKLHVFYAHRVREAVDVPSERAIAPHLELCGRFMEHVSGRKISARVTTTALTSAVEVLRSHTPGAWAGVAIAASVAGRMGRGPRAPWPSSMVESADPLVARAIAARMRAGSSEGAWWRRQFETVTAPDDRLLGISGFLWMTGDALLECLPALSAWADALSENDFARTITVLDHSARMVQSRLTGLSDARIRALSPRVALCLTPATTRADARRLWELRLTKYRGKEKPVVVRCLRLAARNAKTAADWEDVYKRVRAAYRDPGVWVPPVPLWSMSKGTAEAIIGQSGQYPIALVEEAESVLRPPARAASRLELIARREKWFR